MALLGQVEVVRLTGSGMALLGQVEVARLTGRITQLEGLTF